MSGRLSPIIAMVALTTHLWVSMVVAPWHRLVEHRLTAAEPAEKSAVSPEIKAVRGCRCHRHSQPASACLVDSGNRGEAQQNSPAVPDHDDCEVCQVLAQHFTVPDLPAPDLTRERIESRLPVAPAQPLLGCLLEPASRGPPAT